MSRELKEVRCGGRNYLRPGDPCRVAAAGGDRQGFPAKVLRLVEGAGGAVTVDVVVARPHRKAGTIRTVELERVRRVAVATAARKAAGA